MKNNVTKEAKKTMSIKRVVWYSILAGFLLLIANSAIWINNQVFDSQNFTTTVTTSLTSESSRTAMAQEITDEIFKDRPIAKRIAGDFSVKIIGGLLGTDQFENALGTAVERLQVYATSSNQEDVTIELGGIKDVITKLTTISESLGKDTTIDPENIPESITLVNEEDVPDLYKVGVVFLWLAPIALIAALVLLIIPYVKHWNRSKTILVVQGSVITLISMLGLLVGPLFKPPLLSTIDRANGRVIVGNIYDAFIATFNSQTYTLMGIGILAVLVGTTLYLYPYARKAITKSKSAA